MRVFLARIAYSDVYKLLTSRSKRKMIFPPMGILTLAAVLEASGHSVTVVDCEAEGLTPDALVQRILDDRADVFGCGSTTPEFHLADEVLRFVKDRTGVTTVLGGPHGTILSDEVMAGSPHIDFVVRREGEVTFPALLDALASAGSVADIAGVSYRSEDGTVIHNEDRPLVVDLDAFPAPAWHLVDMESYCVPDPQRGVQTCGTIQTARGCPFSCSFCYPMFGHRVRRKSVGRVLDEIEELVKVHGVESLYFIDDTITLEPERLMAICDGMIERDMVVPWQCLARADSVRDDMLERMRAAGCVQVSLGIESGNQGILDSMRKRTTLEMVEHACTKLRGVGFETRGSFVIGLPGDSRKTIRETIEFAKRIDLDRASFNIFTPYPRTATVDDPDMSAKYTVLSTDWSQYTRHGNAVIELPDVSRDELIELQRIANMEFYTRFASIRHHARAWISGNRDAFFYRPFVFAFRERFARTLRLAPRTGAVD
jgi:anaerobic magnesium-protoporphyrin IX monomethyl ester cyclase